MNVSLSRVRLTAAVLLVLGAVLLALIVADVVGPVRLLAMVAFGLVAPGWAVAALLPRMTLALEWATAVALSLVVSVLIGTTSLAVGAWHPTTAVLILIAATSCLLTWHLLRPTPPVVGILEMVDPLPPAAPEASRLPTDSSASVEQAGTPTRA